MYRMYPLTYIPSNFNLYYNFQTIRDRAFKFHMCSRCDETIPFKIFFYIVTFILTFHLNAKNFNLFHNFR